MPTCYVDMWKLDFYFITLLIWKCMLTFLKKYVDMHKLSQKSMSTYTSEHVRSAGNFLMAFVELIQKVSTSSDTTRSTSPSSNLGPGTREGGGGHRILMWFSDTAHKIHNNIYSVSWACGPGPPTCDLAEICPLNGREPAQRKAIIGPSLYPKHSNQALRPGPKPLSNTYKFQSTKAKDRRP